MPSRTLPIHQFAREGNVAGIMAELAKGVSIDARQAANNRTPLMEAVSRTTASDEVVRFLLETGADVNASAGEGGSAGTVKQVMENLPHFQTMIDQMSPDDPMRKQLQDATALMNQFKERPQSRETVLSLALRAGNPQIIRMLLDASADVRYRCPAGYDALINVMHGRAIARDSNLVPIVKLLIDRGSPLDGVSAYGESSLRVASREGRFDAIRMLLNAGSDPAPLEWTPLLSAVALGSRDDVETELKNGPDLSCRDCWSRTAWLLSLQVGGLAKSKLLLAAGANRADRGHCGRTPLMYPVINGHEEMLAWLLSEGFAVAQAKPLNLISRIFSPYLPRSASA